MNDFYTVSPETILIALPPFKTTDCLNLLKRFSVFLLSYTKLGCSFLILKLKK